MASAQQKTLRVACYGGLFTEVTAKYAGTIFTQRTGIKIEWIDGNPSDHLAKMIASKGRAAPFDVAFYDELVQDAAISAGVAAKIDPNIVTNLKYLYNEAKQKDGYGPAVNFWAVGVAYNTEIYKKNGIPEPTSWNDLWNPKLAGRIALPDITQSTAKDLVIATARLLGGNEGKTDGAFEKLAEIKPFYFFRSSADLEAKISAGEVWATVWNNGRANAMIDKGVPLKFFYPKEGGFGHVTVVDVVAGSPNATEAQQFINFLLDPVVQLGVANEIPNGPTTKLLEPILEAYPQLSKRFPVAADLKNLYIADPKVVNAAIPKWVEQWNRVVKR
ncbi:MAG: ABC transporter substrate-binding protein [Pseudorhodoplanes sp.]